MPGDQFVSDESGADMPAVSAPEAGKLPTNRGRRIFIIVCVLGVVTNCCLAFGFFLAVEDIANVIRLGGCVVMGVGVTSEKYRLLLQDATSQDYLIIGAKDSKDAKFIASKMSGELLGPKSLSVQGVEMNIYLVRSETATN